MPGAQSTSPPKSTVWLLVDKLADGNLEERIRTLRAEGLSWEMIARSLHADFGTAVSHETVRSWARQLGLGTSTPDVEARA